MWDLYCGVGGFALHLAAPGRRVVGVETSDEAVVAARTAGRARTTPAQSISSTGDATTLVPDGPTSRPRRRQPAPPRHRPRPRRVAGVRPCHHVVYSSCHLGSLARDLEAMPSLRATQARVFDMFPQTTHLETAVLLERR